MKLNNTQTIHLGSSLAANSCLTDFSSLCIKDNQTCTNECGFIPAQFIVLDGDKLESQIAKLAMRSPLKSVDMIFVAATVSGLNKVVLVELRYNFKNVFNLNRTELELKVSNTLQNLSSSGYSNDYCYFVFCESLVQQARSRMARMNPVIPRKFLTCTTKELVSLHT